MSLAETLTKYSSLPKLTMLIKPPQWFQDSFPPSSLDPSEISPFFLLSAFGIIFVTLSLWLVAFVLQLICFIISKATDHYDLKWRCCKRGLKALRCLTQYTALVLMISSVEVLPSFYIAQFRKGSYQDSASKVSFWISFLVILVYLFLLCCMIYLVKTIPHKSFRNHVKKWRSFEMMFSGFSDEDSLIKYFFPIEFITKIISAIISSLYAKISWVNVSVQLSLTIFIFIIILFKPFFKEKGEKENLNYHQGIVFSIIDFIKYGFVMIYLIVTFGSGIYDWFMVAISILAGASSLIFALFKIAREYSKVKDCHSKTVLMNFYYCVLQQFGMGFEQCKVPNYYKKPEDGGLKQPLQSA